MVLSMLPPCARQLLGDASAVTTNLVCKSLRIGRVAQKCCGHAAVDQAKRQVRGGIEGKSTGDGLVAAQRAVSLQQRVLTMRVQLELHRRCCQVPGDVLASGKEMVVMVIQSVHLEIAGSGADPLVREHSPVESYDSFLPAILCRRAGNHASRPIAQPFTEIDGDHFGETAA